jgi:hypothetical protein
MVYFEGIVRNVKSGGDCRLKPASGLILSPPRRSTNATIRPDCVSSSSAPRRGSDCERFSRYNKYTLGSDYGQPYCDIHVADSLFVSSYRAISLRGMFDLRNKSRQIACRIMRVNSLQDKRLGLEELAADIEELKLLIRLCQETGAFHNPNSYRRSSELAASLSRQAQAWRRSHQTD